MARSRSQKAQSRQAIIESAARLFRQKGVDGVTVAEIMDAAGLTHGGFPRHFDSKQELVAEALRLALTANENEPEIHPGDLNRYAAGYLRPAHRDAAGEGCVFAALGSEMSRAPAPVRRVLTEAMAHQIECLTDAAPGEDPDHRRSVAIGSWAAMVGAMVLARIADSPELSDDILRATRTFLEMERPAQAIPSAFACLSEAPGEHGPHGDA